MKRTPLWYDRMEAIAWVINENSACVDYIDKFSPYDLKLESDYDMYFNPHYESRGNRDEFVLLSMWYKEHADKDDADEMYSFFREAFNQSILDNALTQGSDEALRDFLIHAHAKANANYSERDLLSDMRIIKDLIRESQQIRQGE